MLLGHEHMFAHTNQYNKKIKNDILFSIHELADINNENNLDT